MPARTTTPTLTYSPRPRMHRCEWLYSGCSSYSGCTGASGYSLSIVAVVAIADAQVRVAIVAVVAIADAQVGASAACVMRVIVWRV
jgi:hypothetical protein